MEFAVAVGNVEKGRAIRRPFIGPANTFVKRQPFDLIESLAFWIDLGEIDRRCNVVAQKNELLAVGGHFGPRLPIWAVRHLNNIAARFAGTFIDSKRPDVGFDEGKFLDATEEETAIAAPDQTAADPRISESSVRFAGCEVDRFDLDFFFGAGPITEFHVGKAGSVRGPRQPIGVAG